MSAGHCFPRITTSSVDIRNCTCSKPGYHALVSTHLELCQEVRGEGQHSGEEALLGASVPESSCLWPFSWDSNYSQKESVYSLQGCALSQVPTRHQHTEARLRVGRTRLFLPLVAGTNQKSHLIFVPLQVILKPMLSSAKLIFRVCSASHTLTARWGFYGPVLLLSMIRMRQTEGAGLRRRDGRRGPQEGVFPSLLSSLGGRRSLKVKIHRAGPARVALH